MTAARLTLALAAALALSGAAFAMPGISGSDTGPSERQTARPSEPERPTETRAYERAVKLINQGKYERAIEKLNEAAEAAPDDPDVLNYLGYAHRKLGKRSEAQGYYERALAAKPDHLGAHEYLGELYVDMGDIAKAEAQMAKLEKLCSFGCTELEELKKAIAAAKEEPAGTAPQG